MNQGHVDAKNKGGSQKMFNGNKADYKVLSQADDLKKFND